MSDMPDSDPFVVTKEYRRFAEFCDACRRHRYIGLCYGLPGVGKTLSARHYARWDEVTEQHHRSWSELRRRKARRKKAQFDLVDCRTVFYTAPVANSPRLVNDELSSKVNCLRDVVEGVRQDWRAKLRTLSDDVEKEVDDLTDFTELVIIDEADRLKVASLEHLRDIYDRRKFGLILIGMPGIEKRLSRYAQLYSRVGFVHQFRALGATELRFILEQRWQDLGLMLDQADFTDAEAIAAVMRITGGNFRLLQRLFSQISRVREINDVNLITKEVVEAARESLIIGATA